LLKVEPFGQLAKEILNGLTVGKSSGIHFRFVVLGRLIADAKAGNGQVLRRRDRCSHFERVGPTHRRAFSSVYGTFSDAADRRGQFHQWTQRQ
jgi:hypothetical protein